MNTDEEVIVSPASIDDVLPISEVQRLTYLNTYPNAEFDITVEDISSIDFYSTDKIESRKKSILDPVSPTKIWVAKIQDKVVGYCVVVRDDETNLLRSLYILPEYQSRGIGRKLVEQALQFLDRSKAILLTVAPYNKKAIDFYKKIGFVVSRGIELHPEHIFPTGKIQPEMEMTLQPR